MRTTSACAKFFFVMLLIRKMSLSRKAVALPVFSVNASTLMVSWQSNLTGTHCFTSRDACSRLISVESWLLQLT